MTLSDLHEVAAARLAGWAAWVDSRNTMDEEDGNGAHPQVLWAPCLFLADTLS